MEDQGPRVEGSVVTEFEICLGSRPSRAGFRVQGLGFRV